MDIFYHCNVQNYRHPENYYVVLETGYDATILFDPYKIPERGRE